MREILFRGKHADNGEWVYGDFCRPCNIVYEEIGYDEQLKQDNVPIWNDYEVVQETVGQYIGLKDKSGRKVYEGDIVNCSRGCSHQVIWKQEYGGNFIGGMPCFYLSNLNVGYAWTGNEEIIGNIFDNPELLEK